MKEGLSIDPGDAGRLLRRVMLDQDLSHKQIADRISRSEGTVKRALNGSMGPRTAHRILSEFGGAFGPSGNDRSGPG